MTEEKKPEQQRSTVFVDPPAGTPYVYANFVQARPTSFDIRILFGEVIEFGETTSTVQRRASVTLSWLEAEVLNQILTKQIVAHKEANNQFTEAMIGPPVPEIKNDK